MKSTLLGALLAVATATSAFAQPIKLADVAELSGGGATVGTNWKNCIDLAIEEINAKSGVLGRKLEVSHADSQSNPGVARAQVQNALDVTILMIEQYARSALEISDFGIVLELGQTRMVDKAERILNDPRIGQLFLGGAMEESAA
jgi:hypothetical protein